MVIAGAVSAALAITSPLLEEIEGIRFKPYKDIAGIWTVCAGITGPDVVLGKTYTQKECDQLLQKHIKHAATAVDKAVKVEIPASMRASMYSFTFNAGVGAFQKSTMLKLINFGNGLITATRKRASVKNLRGCITGGPLNLNTALRSYRNERSGLRTS